METSEKAERVRSAAGIFALADRGLLAVRGGDRARWLNGMITNDVSRLAPGPASSGCPALLLTRQGRIVADLHVLLRAEEIWLELAHAALAPARERLSKLVIADDVELVDRSEELARFAVEGPCAPAVVAAALEPATPLGELAADAAVDARIAGADVVIAAFGVSGEPALQILAPRASGAAVHAALLRAGAAQGAIAGDAATLALLRVEAGVPAYGAELSEEVLPPEARLERTISYTKGCYTGQEIVARLRSRGQVAHLLVGLAAEGEAALPIGAPVEIAGERVGEVTSAALSRRHGAIALAFVRRAHAEPGVSATVAGRTVRVHALPFFAAVGADRA